MCWFLEMQRKVSPFEGWVFHLGWDRNSFLCGHPTELEKWPLTQQSSWVGSSWFHHMYRSLTPTAGQSWPWPFLRPMSSSPSEQFGGWSHWESWTVFQLPPNLHYWQYIGVEPLLSSGFAARARLFLSPFSFSVYNPLTYFISLSLMRTFLSTAQLFLNLFRYLFSSSFYKFLKYWDSI